MKAQRGTQRTPLYRLRAHEYELHIAATPWLELQSCSERCAQCVCSGAAFVDEEYRSDRLRVIACRRIVETQRCNRAAERLQLGVKGAKQPLTPFVVRQQHDAARTTVRDDALRNLTRFFLGIE